MSKKLRPAVDLMALKCCTLKVKSPNTICAFRGELIHKMFVLRTLESKTGLMSHRGQDNDGMCETHSIQRLVFFNMVAWFALIGIACSQKREC
jgi:hypothetical protein